MTGDRNPQAAPMAHESMVRNLAAQAEALWPQEQRFLAALELPANPRILDVGCGTGEAVRRMAELLPAASLVGIDLHEPHLVIAREACARFAARVQLRTGDAFALDFPDRSFDLVLCRHLLQAVPEAERVLAEMARVTRRGGWLHVVAEDYGMIHCHPCAVDADRFWREGPITLGRRTGTDLYCGRKAFHWLKRLGLTDVRVEYAMLDTQRVPRSLLVEIFEAWRDGYTTIIAEHTDLAEDEVRASFQAIADSFGDPAAYGVWLVPVVQARVP